jgi:hypothetical protein
MLCCMHLFVDVRVRMRVCVCVNVCVCVTADIRKHKCLAYCALKRRRSHDV